MILELYRKEKNLILFLYGYPEIPGIARVRCICTCYSVDNIIKQRHCLCGHITESNDKRINIFKTSIELNKTFFVGHIEVEETRKIVAEALKVLQKYHNDIINSIDNKDKLNKYLLQFITEIAAL